MSEGINSINENQQPTVSEFLRGQAAKENMEDLRGVVSEACADSALRFIDELSEEDQVSEAESQAEQPRFQGFMGKLRKFGEHVIPVGLGVATRGGIESIGWGGGPLAAAAVGAVTGYAGSYIEYSGKVNDRTGEGAAEIYQKLRTNIKEGEESSNQSRIGRLWKNLRYGLKGQVVESQFGVEDRRSKIEGLFERVLELETAVSIENIDKKDLFNRLINNADIADVHDLVRELSIQSILSGFSEYEDVKSMHHLNSIMILSNLAYLQRVSAESRPDNADRYVVAKNNLEKVWKSAQEEITSRIRSGKFSYAVMGGIERAATSAALVSAISYAIDAFQQLKELGVVTNIPAAVSAAPLESALDTTNEGVEMIVQAAQNPEEFLSSMDAEAEHVQELIEEVQDSIINSSGELSLEGVTSDVRSKIAELFGSDFQNYLEGGGVGPGSRLDRLEVIANIKYELAQSPDLRSIVASRAEEMGWEEMDLWKSIVMRAQYANGATTGVISDLIREEVATGEFRKLGDIDQGLRASGDIGTNWHEVIDWAVNSSGVNPSSDAIVELTQTTNTLNLAAESLAELKNDTPALSQTSILGSNTHVLQDSWGTFAEVAEESNNIEGWVVYRTAAFYAAALTSISLFGAYSNKFEEELTRNRRRRKAKNRPFDTATRSQNGQADQTNTTTGGLERTIAKTASGVRNKAVNSISDMNLAADSKPKDTTGNPEAKEGQSNTESKQSSQEREVNNSTEPEATTAEKSVKQLTPEKTVETVFDGAEKDEFFKSDRAAQASYLRSRRVDLSKKSLVEGGIDLGGINNLIDYLNDIIKSGYHISSADLQDFLSREGKWKRRNNPEFR